MVVEIKNHNGSIQGSEEATHWIQHKVGVKGGEYSSEMRNPIKQMKRQVYLLSSLLKSQGIRVWIDGVVVFTNPDVTLNITESSAQVIKGNNFLSTIHSLSHPIDHHSIEKIKKFVLQLNEKAA